MHQVSFWERYEYCKRLLPALTPEQYEATIQAIMKAFEPKGGE